MNKIPVKQVTSWSFSRYQDYRQCPLKAKLKHIDRIQEPTNDAMARGAAIHNLAEDYIKGKVARLPVELKKFEAEFKMLRKQFKKSINGMCVEDTWAFTNKWDETAWNDWVGCWVRIKLDCAHHIEDDTLVITDWKTGKFSDRNIEDYVEQLELYALGALLLYEHINKVLPRLAYLDHGVIYPEADKPIVFTRSDLPKLKKLWEKRVRPMLNDKKFAPKPNDKCRWCFYSKAKNGDCKF